ncbi:MAG: hypothetical protein LBB86_01075, partial [Oscillospiraceae bacterium]|nr:hypothetical protein [Oscillospiraceae bacterium]
FLRVFYARVMEFFEAKETSAAVTMPPSHAAPASSAEPIPQMLPTISTYGGDLCYAGSYPHNPEGILTCNNPRIIDPVPLQTMVAARGQRQCWRATVSAFRRLLAAGRQNLPVFVSYFRSLLPNGAKAYTPAPQSGTPFLSILQNHILFAFSSLPLPFPNLPLTFYWKAPRRI